jgi:hypothetical protein
VLGPAESAFTPGPSPKSPRSGPGLLPRTSENQNSTKFAAWLVTVHSFFHAPRWIEAEGRAGALAAAALENLAIATSCRPLSARTGPSQASGIRFLPRTSPWRIVGKLFGLGLWRCSSCDPSPSPRPPYYKAVRRYARRRSLSSRCEPRQRPGSRLRICACAIQPDDTP